MKIRLFYILIIGIFCSCSPVKENKSYLKNEFSNVKKFNTNDFKIYVFNLCEVYKMKIDNSERFCKCPEKFYDVAKTDSIKKIEELYLLKHRKTDLVLYLTTKSHKYISNKQKGFLNDRELYEDNIVLRDIESIYIGEYDDDSKIIHFPSFKDQNDIILRFEKYNYPDKIVLDQANIATAENNYDISSPIPLKSIFKEDLVYNNSSKYKITYTYKDTLRLVDRIFITSKKGEVGLSFGFQNMEYFYEVNAKNIKFHPNYSLIQVH